jgi:hypothetical protein
MPLFAAGAPAALRVLGRAIARNTKLIRAKVSSAARSANAELQTVAVRGTGRQPVHPTAFLRQSKRTKGWTSAYANLDDTLRRYFSNTTLRQATRTTDRSQLPVSRTSRAVNKLNGRTPFASTLRPNLTGGALPRTAGGYSIPGTGLGGARYFSHTPAAPAQVVQQVSQAMRAFWTSGQRARYDGISAMGTPRYRAVSEKEDKFTRKMEKVPRNAPGSYIDFNLSPTITALSPLAAAFPFVSQGFKDESDILRTPSLNEDGLLDILSVDFARALKDLAGVMSDLKRLANLGDLPVLLDKGSVIRVRFPGVDANALERLCDDVGVQRGIVRQDENFDASVGAPVALRFPFAPDADQPEAPKTLSSPGGSLRSHGSEQSSVIEDGFLDEYMDENPWLSSPPAETEGYESMSPQEPSSGEHLSEEFEGLEGIYRFLEECDRTRFMA